MVYGHAMGVTDRPLGNRVSPGEQRTLAYLRKWVGRTVSTHQVTLAAGVTTRQAHAILSMLRTRGMLISTPVGKYVKWQIMPSIIGEKEEE